MIPTIMNKHHFNEKELIAFKNVVKAIKQAKKLGISFYGLQNNLVGYNKFSANYIDRNSDTALLSSSAHNGIIPYESASVLTDSGADDYYHFNQKDDNPEKRWPDLD